MDWSNVRYARNGDVLIAYRTLGDAPLDLLFVSGFVSHLEIFTELPAARRFFERLARFARVICFDKRGMGLSDRSGGEYTIEAVAEDMVAVLDAVGSERPAIFGVSEGGPATTYFAATQPDRTRAIVEYGTYARLAAAPDYPEGIALERIRRTTAAIAEDWGGTGRLEWWAPSWADDPAARRWWGRLLRAGTSPGAMASLQRMYERLDVRSLLGSIHVPALVMWRAGDRLVPRELSRAVADGIPGSRAVEQPGSDHLFIAGDQDALLGEIEEFLTGRRAASPAERMLATVLFTDIVGSTQRAAALGDARWRELLAEHDRITRSAVEAERGRYVKSTGDGALAIFPGPGRAIAAARAQQAGVAHLGVEVRAGVHTGEADFMDEDVGGLAVHIGARVGAAAGSGEILVSQTVRDLVVGSELSFDDRGLQVLKGVPGKWRLFAVADEAT